MTHIHFDRAAGDAGYLFTFWPNGELRMFRDRAAAEGFATRQGLRPIFDSTVTPHEVIEDGHDGGNCD